MIEYRYRQVDLSSDGCRMVCWVKDSPKLKLNVHLTLKETGDRVWWVVWVSQMVVTKQPRKDWKVGGLV